MNELKSVLNNIQHFLSEGIINEERANQLAENAINDYNELIGEEDFSNYNNGDFNMSNMAEFSAANDSNSFGDSLLALGQAMGYDDVMDYTLDLADSMGADPEELLMFMSGDILPTSELVDLISDTLELDEEIREDLHNSAIESIIEDTELYDDGLEEEYNDSEYDYSDNEYYYGNNANYYDEGSAELEEYLYQQELANAKAEEIALAALEEAQEANYNAAILNEQMAEFSAVAEVSSALNERDMYAQSLVMQGKMPPAVYQDLFGNFSSNEDRIAAFSQVCAVNGTDASSELYSMDKILDTFENYGDTALFNRHAYDVVDEEEVLEELVEYDQAALNRQLAYAKKANLI